MNEQVLIAGFGGQGILSAGQLLAFAGMAEGKHVAWIPSYGPEMRGGTANCGVSISDAPISSPLVTEPTALIAMNQPSLDKFEDSVLPQGIIIINSSLVQRTEGRRDVVRLAVPAGKLAGELGNVRVAASVLIGAYAGFSGVVGPETLCAVLEKVLPARRHGLIPVNRTALQKGAEIGARYRHGFGGRI